MMEKYTGTVTYGDHSATQFGAATLDELYAKANHYYAYYSQCCSYANTRIERLAEVCTHCDGYGRVRASLRARRTTPFKTCAACTGTGIARTL